MYVLFVPILYHHSLQTFSLFWLVALHNLNFCWFSSHSGWPNGSCITQSGRSDIIVEGSLEVKLPTIWTDEKNRGGKSQRREEKKKEDQRRERVRRKKMQVHKQIEKSRNTVFFQCFGAPEGRRISSLKRRVRSHLAR